jgi:hypothetical protein
MGENVCAKFSDFSEKFSKFCLIGLSPDLYKCFLLLQNHEYSLGNGFTQDNPQLAIDEFMKRDFPEILDFSQKPHDVIFIPDAFQFGPVGSKVPKFLVFSTKH